MCNLYIVTKGQQAIREVYRAMTNTHGADAQTTKVGVRRRAAMLAVIGAVIEAGAIRRASACSVELVCFFAPDQAAVSQRVKQILADVVKVWTDYWIGGRGYCGSDIAAHRVSEIPHLDVLGHAWEEGGKQLNLALSEHRAHAVADELIALGVGQSYLTVVQLGDTKPRIPEA